MRRLSFIQQTVSTKSLDIKSIVLFSFRVDDRVDFSYSSTDDNGDKGHVRMRQTAGKAPSDAEKA